MATEENVKTETLCACGVEISRWSSRCGPCHDQIIIDKAEKVEPSSPLCLVGDDTFFGDVEDAAEAHAGQWAHPCEEVPLTINSKRLAADFVERAVEDMCEEAFEDAECHVKGQAELEAALVAALEAFNAAQTSSSWMPITKAVFQIPALAKARGEA
jgi:hypothetical protein